MQASASRRSAPCTMRASSMESCAAISEMPAPPCGLSVSSISERCMSRCRESSGRSLGSHGQEAGGVEVVEPLGDAAEVVVVREGRLAPLAAPAHEGRALHGGQTPCARRPRRSRAPGLRPCSAVKLLGSRRGLLPAPKSGIEPHDGAVHVLALRPPAGGPRLFGDGGTRCRAPSQAAASTRSNVGSQGVLGEHLVARHAVDEHGPILALRRGGVKMRVLRVTE